MNEVETPLTNDEKIRIMELAVRARIVEGPFGRTLEQIFCDMIKRIQGEPKAVVIPDSL